MPMSRNLPNEYRRGNWEDKSNRLPQFNAKGFYGKTNKPISTPSLFLSFTLRCTNIHFHTLANVWITLPTASALSISNSLSYFSCSVTLMLLLHLLSLRLSLSFTLLTISLPSLSFYLHSILPLSLPSLPSLSPFHHYSIWPLCPLSLPSPLSHSNA